MSEITAEDKNNEARFAGMTDEQKLRMKAVEEATEILQKAQVPFVLFSSASHDLSKEGTGWWQVSKLVYNEDLKEKARLMGHAITSLYYTSLEYFSELIPAYGIGVFHDKTPVCLFHNGNYVPFQDGQLKDEKAPA